MKVDLYENPVPDAQREVLDGLPVLVFLERAGVVVFANAEARELLGIADGEWTDRRVEDLLWGLFPGTAEPKAQLSATKRGSLFHATLPATNGRLLPIEGTYSILNAELREGVIVAHLSDQERVPKSRLMEDVLASLPEAVAIEHKNHVLYTNPAFSRMFGYTAEEASGGSLRELIVPETRFNENAALAKAADENGVMTMETVRKNKAGEFVDVSLQIAPLLVDSGRVGYVYTFRDIGEHKQAEEKLQHDAMHDVLTGLPNRALFLDRLNLSLSRRMRRPDYGCGVLYLDLDKFKEINDGLGHAAGDALLMAAAGRLLASLRPQDSAARLGGDEFAVLVENILTAYDLEIVAGRILRELERPFDIFGHVVRAGASIGAAMAGPDHTNSDMLVRDADFAMYRAKQSGGGRYEIFDKHLEVAVTSQQERERELRTALDKRRFAYRYQPIYRLANGKLEALESLVCLLREDGSVEDFPDLLSVAEETGLSIILGRQTLDAVCTQVHEWSVRAPQLDPTVIINVTRRQLYHPDLVTHLKRALAATGADPSRLLIEAPESAFNDNPDAAVAVLQRLADCRIRAAIDDFGGSLAPLNHLIHLPIAMVKLAPRLTAAAVSSGRQLAALEAIIRLGNALDIQVVAQRIETQDQLAALARMGCTLGEGPLLSPPVDSAQAMAIAEKGYWTIASGTTLWS
ncbi:MAG: EAL domain-containing protein [Terracidiphilus sp.]|jgi:diguanylate cyclase (GGDEF)-like protein/PAS domain S-box-containing protein